MDTIDSVAVAISADTSAFTAGLREAETQARAFGSTISGALTAAQAPERTFGSALTDAFTGLALKGRDLDDVIEGLGQRLSNLALNVALKPLEQGLAGSIGGLLGGLFAQGGGIEGGHVRAFADGGVIPQAQVRAFADGAAFDGGRVLALAAGGALDNAPVRAFADGGVVAAPTYFPMASGVGLMGEAGAEAILPLARGTDGALGVRTQPQGGRTVVNVSVATPDPGAFRRSDAYLSGLIARAVARGQRSL